MGEVAELRPSQAPALAAMVPANLDQALRLADMMSRGGTVPDHLKGKPADCLMVIEQASRWKMSPFAVAQCTSVIKGKLMYEGKLVAAAVSASGLLQGRLSYEHAGQGQGRSVTVSGVIRGENQPRSVTVTLDEVQTDNGMWKKQPDQQLVYAGTRVWARRHLPEVMLGVYTPDEFTQAEVIDGQAGEEPPEPTEYPAEKFDENKASWGEIIAEGRKTADQLILFIESKDVRLTDEQKAALRKFEIQDAEVSE